jgi:excisionase family DNA binding protein
MIPPQKKPDALEVAGGSTPKLTISLDSLLTADEAAQWLQVSESQLRRLVRAKRIPAVMLGRKILRFHPRTILTRLRQTV